MSALGHEQTSRHVPMMSVLPLKADIHKRGLHVRLVPLVDIFGSSSQITEKPKMLYLITKALISGVMIMAASGDRSFASVSHRLSSWREHRVLPLLRRAESRNQARSTVSWPS
jgi:hypothetical protein